MAHKKYIRVFLLVLIASATLVSYAVAQDSKLDADAQYIFGNVMSPYCPGRLLNDCPSGKAAELKQSIRGMLANGKSKDEIFAELLATYGEAARAAPKKSGFGLLAYLAPLFFLALGALIVRMVAKNSIAKESSAPEVLDPEDARKIEELL